MDTQAIIEELLGIMFSIQSVQSGYKKKELWRTVSQVPECTGSRESNSARKAEKMAL
jgi:hypothetical protein